MNEKFANYLETLHIKYEELIDMKPVSMGSPLRNAPTGGVYLFSEGNYGDRHLYVGRSKRELNKRLRNHISKTSKDSPLAFKLAREATGNTTSSYSGENIRKNLLNDPVFVESYQAAKERIRNMKIRWVHEPDPTRQALLELYVFIILETPYNDFDTH